MARLRMDGVSSDALVPTPPAGKATIFYNSVDRVYKVKLDDGSVAPIGSGGGGAVDSVNGQTGVVVLTKADIGLGNVDNTSDANKPISNATQLALNAQELRISTAEGEIDTLQIDVGALQTSVGTLQTDVSALQSGLSDLGGRVFTVEGEVVGLDSAVSGLDTRVTTLEGSVGTLQTDVGTLQTDVSSIQTEVGTIESAISNLETAVAAKYDASNPAGYVDATGAAAAAPVQSVAGKTGEVSIDLSTDVTGALPVSLGGSGRTDFPAMQLLFGAPDALSIDRSEFFTYDASIGLLLNVGGQMQTRSLAQDPADPSATVINDKVEVSGDDGTGPAYTRIKRDYLEAKKVLPTKELSASAGFDGVDSWLGVSETTNEGNNISMAKIFPNKAQLFTVDVGAGTGPQPILPVESYDLTTKQYVDNQIAAIPAPVMTDYVRKDGTTAMTGDLNMQSSSGGGTSNSVGIFITQDAGLYQYQFSFIPLASSPLQLWDGMTQLGTLAYDMMSLSWSYMPTLGSPITTLNVLNSIPPFVGIGLTILDISFPDSYTPSPTFRIQYGGAPILTHSRIVGLGDGSGPRDAVNKQQLDSAIASIPTPDLSNYLQKSGGTMTGSIDMASSYLVYNLPDPAGPQEAATKNYVDTAIAAIPAPNLTAYLQKSGGTMTGAINMGSNLINSVTDPVSAQDAATKNYVDTALTVAQIRHVSKNGSDSTGDGSIGKPYLTIMAAMNSITDATPTKRYAIRVAAGSYTETSFQLKANVFVVGESKESVRVTGALTLGPSFTANSSFDNRSGFSMITLLSACDFNWNTVQSAAGKLYFNEVIFGSTVNMYGYNNAIAQAQFNACIVFSTLTISGINVGVFTNNVCYGNVTLNQHPNGGMATILNATGGYCGGTITQTTAVSDFNRRCASFLRGFPSESLVVDGPSSYADVDLVSGSKNGAQSLNGGNVIALTPIVSHDITTQMITPRNTNSHNMGDWGKQWTWNFGYVHASTGTDLYLISYPASYGADSSGKNIGIYTDGAGLQADVNGGSIDLETAAVSGTGVRGNIRMNARNIDHTQSPSVNFVLENGATGSRPASPVVGQMYFDTTLNKPIFYTGSGWVDAAGTGV